MIVCYQCIVFVWMTISYVVVVVFIATNSSISLLTKLINSEPMSKHVAASVLPLRLFPFPPANLTLAHYLSYDLSPDLSYDLSYDSSPNPSQANSDCRNPSPAGTRLTAPASSPNTLFEPYHLKQSLLFIPLSHSSSTPRLQHHNYPSHPPQ